MRGKRNVSVCSGHELANALYMHQTEVVILMPEMVGKVAHPCRYVKQWMLPGPQNHADVLYLLPLTGN